MKTIIKLYVPLLLSGLTLITSCTKEFEKINTDPVSVGQEQYNPNYLLSTAQLTYTGSVDFAYETWRGNLIYAATMMQGMSSVIGYWAGDKYMLNEGYTAAYWEKAYPDQIKYAADLVEFTKDKPQYNNVHQMGRIWKALMFERLTDLYGDIPYFDAGKGYYTANLYPKYDAQQAIYVDLLKEVDEASTALTAGGDAVIGDLVFGGDVAKWKRFGNSLMLRMAMRLTKADGALAQTYITKAVGKTMLSDADNAMFRHDNNGGRVTQNRNAQVLLGDGGQENYYTRWSSTFINYLKSNNDPRLSKVAVTKLYLTDVTKAQNPAYITTASVQKGMPNGKDLSGIAGRDVRQDPSYTDFTDYSSPNPGMLKRDGNTFILTYAETELLWAEAAQRYNIGGSAVTHYNAGVTAAMTFLSQYDAAMAINATDAANYLAAHPYVATNGLEMIAMQYWAHTITMLDFYEAWSNWRRTAVPALVPVVYPNTSTGGVIPRRFPYPLAEGVSNAANYKTAAAAVPGGDKLTGRVWWDK
ncbi:SusD/RagB family nutrient-binding outer membrane lipoprotein [Pedobacter sandarakinus]|uniref:SusD/RagB family nutrient-binding outer membrane lipoprotein n=1 Tax=Pedobacter sandarakinus TaxID=353156 RepID=UPI002247BE69|nr:SusD/RagB family nutrient-binding outer membrane lipoprotein [Pedobacter sandarakinus]MCX2573151.1 SusD/RagB family nutrient-binding outer membrane lipoprotein [Pedobacter sandarakinus]